MKSKTEVTSLHATSSYNYLKTTDRKSTTKLSLWQQAYIYIHNEKSQGDKTKLKLFDKEDQKTWIHKAYIYIHNDDLNLILEQWENMIRTCRKIIIDTLMNVATK